MPSVFSSGDVRSLLDGKRVVLMGCSNIRATYKDLLCLYQFDQLISNQRLKTKMEKCCLGDILICHGKKTNGRDYLEERIFKMRDTTISFYFLTRIYSDYVKSIIARMDASPPDVIMVGSCLWDITRWGPDGVKEYKKNLHQFFSELKQHLPSHTLVMWLTTAPLAQDVRGGFLIPQLEFLKYSLRYHVLEANYFCRETADRFGFDVVDIHYHLRMLLEHRAEDGIHWMPLAVRLCTNVVLTHITISWGETLPKSNGFLTEKEKKILQAEKRIDYVSEEDTANESILPADLSFSAIFASDERVMTEVIKNATNVPPAEFRPKAKRGNWRGRFRSGKFRPFQQQQLHSSDERQQGYYNEGRGSHDQGQRQCPRNNQRQDPQDRREGFWQDFDDPMMPSTSHIGQHQTVVLF